MVLRPGARLRHAHVQTFGEGVWHFHRQRALLERDSGLNDLVVNLGGAYARSEVASELVGPGAESEMLGSTSATAGSTLTTTPCSTTWSTTPEATSSTRGR